MKMKMKMRLQFLLLVAAAFPSCWSQRGRDSSEDSRQNSSRNSRRDSRDPRPGLLPPPLLLVLPAEPGPARVRCLAPRRFPGSRFQLFQGMPGMPLLEIAAAPELHWAEFPVPGAARCLRCRYRSPERGAWRESELSSAAGSAGLADAGCDPSAVPATGAPSQPGTLREDPPWLLPVALGVTVPALLLLLGAAAAAWRVRRRRRGRSPAVPAPSFPLAPAPTSPSP